MFWEYVESPSGRLWGVRDCDARTWHVFRYHRRLGVCCVAVLVGNRTHAQSVVDALEAVATPLSSFGEVPQ